MEAIDLLLEFNKKYNANATLVHKSHFGDDIADGQEYNFYRLSESQNGTRPGELYFAEIGAHRSGEFFKDIGFVPSLNNSSSVRSFFPVSNTESEFHSLIVNYTATRFNSGFQRNLGKSIIEFKRWWISDWDDLGDNFPEEAKRVEQLLLEEIDKLAATARERDYKSGWIYHRFMDKYQFFNKEINNNLLANTRYYFSPSIFYNLFAHKRITYSKRELSSFLP